ncbi:MAG: PfkB family carbohydrate kinase [Phycisphaerales bacterium]
MTRRPVIHVVGSMMIDRVVRVAAIPRPGETVAARSSATFAGGKGANQAAAAAKGGARVRMLGRTGSDGKFIRDALREAGVDVRHVVTDDASSGAATVMVAADGENAIVIAPESNTRIEPAAIERFLGKAREGDVVLFQNECSSLEDGMALAAARGLRVWLNAAPADASLATLRYERLSGLIVNETEAEALTGEREPMRALRVLAERMPRGTVVLTLGAQGAIVASEDRVHAHRGFVVDAVDTVGCGDAFVGAFLAAKCAGGGVEGALARGNAAGALAAMQAGAMRALPDSDEIDAAVTLGEGVRLPARRGTGLECLACGHALAAMTAAARCAECGAELVENPFPSAWRSKLARAQFRLGAWIAASAFGCIALAGLMATVAFTVLSSSTGGIGDALGGFVFALFGLALIGSLTGSMLMVRRWPSRSVGIWLGVASAVKIVMLAAALTIGLMPQLLLWVRFDPARLVGLAFLADCAFIVLMLFPPRVVRLTTRRRVMIGVAASFLAIAAALFMQPPNAYLSEAESAVGLCMFVGSSAGAAAAASLAVMVARVERRGVRP